MLADWLDALRYDHPGVYHMLLVVVGTITLFVCFMLLPASPMLSAVGITELQKRVSAAANGLYWSARAALHREGEVGYTQIYGNVEGVDPSGKLIVTVAQGDKWVRHHLTLANVKITDLYGAVQIVGSLRMENARFDIYGKEQVVTWIRNVPLNVKLIEAGVAKPDPVPPTNIFDLAFATYYWGIVKGRNS